MRVSVLLTAAIVVAGATVGAVAAATSADASTRVSSKTLLGQLRVASEHGAGYQRSLFKLWSDADHDGCNTRYEVLIKEATTRPHVGSGCRLTGGRWRSPYDGVRTGDPSSLDIDHLVPLAEAWQSGAYRWNASTRERYANDLGYGPDLVAVTAHANRSKGDAEPAGYLPPRRSFDCTYEAWWVAVKWRWHLAVNPHEKRWLGTHLSACHWPSVAKPGRPHIGIRSSSGGSGGGTSATSGVAIDAIYFDSPGSDTGSNSSLNAEWVKLVNTTSHSRTITGWKLSDAVGHTYTFGRFTVHAHDYVRVHTGRGTNALHNRYWDQGGYIWNNSGDRARLRNANGTTVDTCSYTGSADPKATC